MIKKGKIVHVSQADPNVKGFLERAKHLEEFEYYCKLRCWYIFSKNKENIKFFVWSQRFIRGNVYAAPIAIALYISLSVIGLVHQNYYLMGSAILASFVHVVYLLVAVIINIPKEKRLILDGNIVAVDVDDIEDED